MKRLEIRIYTDVNSNDETFLQFSNFEEVKKEIFEKIKDTVRVDLIDEREI